MGCGSSAQKRYQTIVEPAPKEARRANGSGVEPKSIAKSTETKSPAKSRGPMEAPALPSFPSSLPNAEQSALDQEMTRIRGVPRPQVPRQAEKPRGQGGVSLQGLNSGPPRKQGSEGALSQGSDSGPARRRGSEGKIQESAERAARTLLQAVNSQDPVYQSMLQDATSGPPKRVSFNDSKSKMKGKSSAPGAPQMIRLRGSMPEPSFNMGVAHLENEDSTYNHMRQVLDSIAADEKSYQPKSSDLVTSTVPHSQYLMTTKAKLSTNVREPGKRGSGKRVSFSHKGWNTP